MPLRKRRCLCPGWLVLFCGLISADADCQTGRTPAFPGAEGFGAFAKGGRGGNVIAVTNLSDSGPGSLRAALEARGPRTVVFRVSGSIELKSVLTIAEPYVTVAGQTAPGDGICLKHYGHIVQNTHDVVLRFLRFRPGDEKKTEQDALAVYRSRNVIIDHCSAGWGTDETLSVTGGGTDSVTVQWCFITESLNRSVHHKGEHGYGSLLRVDGDITFHHNLYANHKSRNPRPGVYGDTLRGCMLDFRNNAVYNWGEAPGYTAADKASINLVANYYKPGPSTGESRECVFRIGGRTTALYADQNVLEGYEDKGRNNWNIIDVPKSVGVAEVRLPVPLIFAPVATETAPQAFARVLDRAGAALPVRDAVDLRIVRQVVFDSGSIIDSQADVGGWPEYRTAEAPEDADRDGMPDRWEKTHGLNPADPSDGNRFSDPSGYTNLENYLNEMAR